MAMAVRRPVRLPEHGYLVASQGDGYQDVSIVLPTAGYREGSNANDKGTVDPYWPSSPYVNTYRTYFRYFDASSLIMYDRRKSVGQSVRAVVRK